MPPKSRGQASKASPLKATPSATSRLEPLFSTVPVPLEPLLQFLDKPHIYITSIDTKPWQFKAKIFAVPTTMNIAIVALIIWRAYSIGPFYLNILAGLLGYPNHTTLNTAVLPLQVLIGEVGYRALNFIADLIIYLVVWPWPAAFFSGQENGSPFLWRMAVGFQDKEVIVRRSRKWDADIGNVVDVKQSGADETKLFVDLIQSATSTAWMRDRTGYLLVNKDWDLDWEIMDLCTQMVARKEMSMDDFKTTVLVPHETLGWVVYNAMDVSGSKAEEDSRRKIIAFKDELTAMGKENLFFRWIELIQYESSQPGGFTAERQVSAMEKAKKMFEDQGVDFEAFWSKLGGTAGMPGMDQT